MGRILVVDDVARNVKLLEAKLTAEYYSVITAASGMEALTQAATHLPDVILLDVMMPQMDGYETCRKLKENPLTASIPVVMVTALSDNNNKIEGLRAGAVDFITKPIDDTHLFSRVRSLIRLKRHIDELEARQSTAFAMGLKIDAINDVESNILANVAIINEDVIETKNISEFAVRLGQKAFLASVDNDFSDTDVLLISQDINDGLGLKAANEIKRKYPNTAIILLIDEDERSLLAKALEMGIDDYVLTPLDYGELAARILTQIRIKKYRDKLESNISKAFSEAAVDDLTGLYNRRFFEAHFAKTSNDSGHTLLVIDIDNFKQINDSKGHGVGDETIKYVAGYLRDSIRPSDTLCRIGGDEFVVVLTNTAVEDGEMVANRLVKNIWQNITISIGLANSGGSVADVFNRADQALLKAKQTKNCVVAAS
jgi:two-component system, cell cycle response regulator